MFNPRRSPRINKNVSKKTLNHSLENNGKVKQSTQINGISLSQTTTGAVLSNT